MNDQGQTRLEAATRDPEQSYAEPRQKQTVPLSHWYSDRQGANEIRTIVEVEPDGTYSPGVEVVPNGGNRYTRLGKSVATMKEAHELAEEIETQELNRLDSQLTVEVVGRQEALDPTERVGDLASRRVGNRQAEQPTAESNGFAHTNGTVQGVSRDAPAALQNVTVTPGPQEVDRIGELREEFLAYARAHEPLPHPYVRAETQMARDIAAQMAAGATRIDLSEHYATGDQAKADARHHKAIENLTPLLRQAECNGYQFQAGKAIAHSLRQQEKEVLAIRTGYGMSAGAVG